MVHFFFFGRYPRSSHAQIFCMWCKHLYLAWTRYGHHICVSLSLSSFPTRRSSDLFSIFDRDPWAHYAQIYYIWWRQLYLAWTRYVHHAWMSLPFLWVVFADLWCIFSFLADIPGPPMPKYSVCGVNICTWPGQGMVTISACLFLFLLSLHDALPISFPFLTEILGHTMPKFTISGGDSFTWLGQGMYIMLGCLFLFSGQFLLIYGAFFHFWQRSQGPPCPNILYVV